MGSRSRSSNSSATTTNARQYTATDDAIIGNNNSRSETFVNDESVRIDDRSVTSFRDESVTSFVDNSDNSVYIEELSDDVAITSIAASAQLARDLIDQSNRRADQAASAAARQTVENTSKVTEFVANQNAATGDFVSDILLTATEEIGAANKGAAETVAAAANENQQLLTYGAVGAVAVIGAVMLLRG